MSRSSARKTVTAISVAGARWRAGSMAKRTSPVLTLGQVITAGRTTAGVGGCSSDLRAVPILQAEQHRNDHGQAASSLCDQDRRCAFRRVLASQFAPAAWLSKRVIDLN